MIKTIEPGRVVKSIAGHDKGRMYMVLTVTDANFCTVANGKEHGIKNAKKKNIKHLVTFNKVFKSIAEKFKTGKLDDLEISHALHEFNKSAKLPESKNKVVL